MSNEVVIIIPTYNWSTVLPFSIQSIQGQSFDNWELWVVGDGCTDDSEEVVGRFSDKDPRIHWHNLPENVGQQGGPINAAMELSNSEWIAYLGHDDLWLPKHLEHLLALGKKEKADLVYSLCRMIPPHRGKPYSPFSGPQYRRGLWIPPSSFIHRRDRLIEVGKWRLPHELRTDPEIDLLNRFYKTGAKFSFFSGPTVIKFPASCRSNVYQNRPFKEQEHWLGRIQSEPDLEGKLLLDMFMESFPSHPNPSRGQKILSLPRRIKRRLTNYKSTIYNDRRRFKGLDPM